MRQHISPIRARATVLLGATTIALIAACSELASPPRPTLKSPVPARHDAGLGNGRTLSYTVQANDTTGGGVHVIPDSDQFRHTMWLHVTATGTITRTPSYPWMEDPNSVKSWGPNTATIDRGSGWGSVVVGDTGVDILVTSGGPASVSIQSHDPGRIDFDNYQPPGYPTVTCGTMYPNLCNHYSGSMSFTITPLSSDLMVTLDSGTYTPGSIAGANVALSAFVVSGHTIPYETDSSWWSPDDPSDPLDSAVSGPAYTACGDPAPCQRRVRGSGTLSIAGWVNGVWRLKTAHVTAATLDVSPKAAMVHAGDPVTFSATWSNGASTANAVWSWTPDGPSGTTAACAPGSTCATHVHESGTMKATITRGGVTRTAQAHVTVFQTFVLAAAPLSIHAGDSVTFTPQYDGSPGPAAAWRWIPDVSPATDVSCSVTVSVCKAPVHSSGTMWAYSATSGGDSSSKHIDVAPPRHLSLSPSDTVWVQAGSTISFVATAAGAPILNPEWGGDDWAGPSAVAPRKRGSPRANSLTHATNSTCISGVTSCTDVASGAYVRTITATVDDSVQSASVTVIAGVFVNDLPDSSGGSAAGPCPTCQKADALKKINLDSIMRNMDTSTVKCDSAHMMLRQYLSNDWIYTYTGKNGNWGEWHSSSFFSNPWIELSTALWTPPGKKVVMGMQNGIPIILTVEQHRLERTTIHEALHAAHYDHDSADQFASATLKACMNPNSRNW